MILGVALLFMLPPSIVPGAFTGDAQIHWSWQYDFSRQFWAGEILPRWLITRNDGFGSPAFFVYPPLTQWLCSFFAIAFPTSEGIPARFVCALILFMFLSGLGAKMWINEITNDESSAHFGGLLYMLLPYHAYVNTFQRGAFAEQAAMALLPWIFRGVRRIRNSKRPDLSFTVSLFLVFISHAPSALFLAPIIAIYAAKQVFELLSARLAIIYCTSSICAVLLAGFYLAPALLEASSTHQDTMFVQYFNPSRWLLLSNNWPDFGMQVVIETTTAIYAILALAALSVVICFGNAILRKRSFAILTGFSAILLFMSPAASLLWEHDTVFSKIQFPWRLLSVATLSIAALGALALQSIKETTRPELSKQARFVPILTIAALLTINYGMLGARLYRAHVKHRAPPTITETLRDRRGEFDFRLGDLDRAASAFQRPPTLNHRKNTQPIATFHGGRMLTFETQFARPTLVWVHQFNFTGWTIKVDGRDKGRTFPLTSEVPVAALNVPEGPHSIELILSARKSERLGLIFTAVGLLVFLALCTYQYLWRPRETLAFSDPASTSASN
jgi:hypothetical protein